jgi:hypothetical protein
LPHQPELVLVTDLDGTLLGGSSAWRRRLYAWLVEKRERVLHIFCTGRDLRSVARLLQEEVRVPAERGRRAAVAALAVQMLETAS